MGFVMLMTHLFLYHKNKLHVSSIKGLLDQYQINNYVVNLILYLNNILKGPKREKLHAMHVKELIKTNYFER